MKEGPPDPLPWNSLGPGVVESLRTSAARCALVNGHLYTPHPTHASTPPGPSQGWAPPASESGGVPGL